MVIAQVRFFGPEQGGRKHPPLHGYHPQVTLNDGQFASCVVESLEGEETFSFDRDHRVSLHLLLTAASPDTFAIGRQVEFYEGSHLVGSGIVLEIS